MMQKVLHDTDGALPHLRWPLEHQLFPSERWRHSIRLSVFDKSPMKSKYQHYLEIASLLSLPDCPSLVDTEDILVDDDEKALVYGRVVRKRQAVRAQAFKTSFSLHRLLFFTYCRSPITLRKILIAWICLFQKRPRAKHSHSNPAARTRRLRSISELRVRFRPTYSLNLRQAAMCLDAHGDSRLIHFGSDVSLA
ncbi:hypothetical protein DE146DRAFT_160783 [Phaeosphaeria sp. MPI-PUGE-AT-0046c]|nr:hypothetical protein DE146DRAFT_160783 [Phaeosphaeria sp. MPI-PUGE-AT-0046c]